jgi:hypothetical protein
VHSGPFPPIELVAEFTVDGETWTSIELVAPTDIEVAYLFIAGNRLIAFGTPPTTLASPPFRTMLVAATENLEDWSIQSVPGVLETLSIAANDFSITANDFGWVAHVAPDSTWAAAWDGEPTAIDETQAAEGATVTALATGFLAAHDDIEFSVDGVTWTPATGAPDDLSIEGVLQLDDGTSAVIAFGDSCETEIYRVGLAGQVWERVHLELPGAAPNLLPTGRGSYANGSSWASAVLVDSSGPIVSSTVWERDGLRLTSVWCIYQDRNSDRYELVDIDADTVVVAEDTGWRSSASGYPFEHMTWDDEIVTVEVPTGDEVITFDAQSVVGSRLDGQGPGGEVWMLTTADGIDWFVDDLSQLGVSTVVRNGDTVLVGSPEEWFRYQVPSP